MGPPPATSPEATLGLQATRESELALEKDLSRRPISRWPSVKFAMYSRRAPEVVIVNLEPSHTSPREVELRLSHESHLIDLLEAIRAITDLNQHIVTFQAANCLLELAAIPDGQQESVAIHQSDGGLRVVLYADRLHWHRILGKLETMRIERTPGHHYIIDTSDDVMTICYAEGTQG